MPKLWVRDCPRRSAVTLLSAMPLTILILPRMLASVDAGRARGTSASLALACDSPECVLSVAGEATQSSGR